MNTNLKIREEYTKKKFLIFESAFVLFTNKDYSEVSIADICVHSNISRSAFRGYFEKKGELLNELATIVLQEINEEIRKITLDGNLLFSEKLIGVFKIVYKNQKHFRLLQQANVVAKNNLFLKTFSTFLEESRTEFFLFLETNIKESADINPVLKNYDSKEVASLLFSYFETTYFDTFPKIARQTEESVIQNLKIFVKIGE